MRITNSMLSDMFLKDMNTNLENLSIIQKQRTSGKNFSKPSDDPSNVIRAMQLHSDINSNKQYNKNINNVINWLDVTDTALDQIGSQLGKIRDKLLAAKGPAYGETERKAVKDEINEIIGSMAQSLNTTFDGKYVFSGTRVTSKPVDATVNATNGNKQLIYVKKDGTELTDAKDNELIQMQQKVKAEISQGVVMDYNVTAPEILNFKDKGGNNKDLREALQQIVNHLDGNNDVGSPPADNDEKDKNILKLVNGDLQNITDAIDNVLTLRSQLGAKQNRMDNAEAMNKETNFNMQEILSHTEDVNIVEKTMEFAVLQSVYIASLQTSAKVLQPTLMDYLR